MNYLISYDVSKPRLRDKICKCLERNACKRIQKSVFLAIDMPAKIKLKILSELKVISGMSATDETLHILFVPIDEEAIKKIESIGESVLWEEANENPNFLFI
jgi:CRISPR-associated endonuclease Cas2